MILLGYKGHCDDKYINILAKRILILIYPNIEGSRGILVYYRYHGIPTFALNNAYLSLLRDTFPEADLAFQARTARVFCI